MIMTMDVWYTLFQYLNAHYTDSTGPNDFLLGQTSKPGYYCMYMHFYTNWTLGTIFNWHLKFENFTYILIYQCPGKFLLWYGMF